jgi:hypothetical protein
MGEYVVDVKFRDLKRRMSFIKEKLGIERTSVDIIARSSRFCYQSCYPEQPN